jgi:protein disulfide-isomerase
MLNVLKSIAFIVAVVVGTALSASAEGWITDFEEAKTLAAEKNVPIIANFSGSDWCGWCIKLDREVLSTPEFLEYAKDNLVLLNLDFPARKKQDEGIADQNKALAAKYGIRGYPTVLVLDATGNVVAKTGYRQGGPEAYVKHLKELIAK